MDDSAIIISDTSQHQRKPTSDTHRQINEQRTATSADSGHRGGLGMYKGCGRAEAESGPCARSTKRTILQQDDPNHLRLW